MKRNFILILIGIAFGFGLVSCSKSIPQLTKEELYNHIEFLASDSLKGRYPGTAEDRIAAEYIAQDFQNSGLELMFDEGLQAFEIITNLETGKNNSLTINDKSFVLNEDFQADIGKRILERLGYRVTAKTSSMEAYELFRQNPNAFDLVITDMTMPDLTGDVLARKLIAVRPDIPIIVCTGYSERINANIVKEIGIKELAMKPVVMKDIAQMIERVLSRENDRRNKAAGAG